MKRKKGMETLKGDYELIRADGTRSVVVPADGKKFTLAELQSMVKGPLTLMHLGAALREVIRSVDMEGNPDVPHLNPHSIGAMVREGWVLVVTEDGLCRNLPINREAVEIQGGLVVGDVLLCRRDATP
jgi:hypothetical protein